MRRNVRVTILTKPLQAAQMDSLVANQRTTETYAGQLLAKLLVGERGRCYAAYLSICLQGSWTKRINALALLTGKLPFDTPRHEKPLVATPHSVFR